MKSISSLAAAAAIVLAVTSCKGRTMENAVPTGDTIEVNPMGETGADGNSLDSMNHDSEAVTLPDAIEVPD